MTEALATPQDAMAIAKARSFHPAIDGYLTEVRRHMHGLVPRDRVEMFLEETTYWILCRANMLKADGLAEDAAVALAIQEHEDPQAVAFGLIEDYFESRADGPLVKRMGRANAIVFTLFGLGSGVYFLLLQLIIAMPSSGALTGAMSPAQMSRFYPAQLPYPDLSWQFLVACGYPVVAPFLLGWLAGRFVPVRSKESVFMGLVPIIMFSALASFLLLPDKTGVFFTLLQAVVWLPVGCWMAQVSSSRQRRSRQRP